MSRLKVRDARHGGYRHEKDCLPRIAMCWGQHFWARNYLRVAVGELTKEMPQKYLAHSFERDPYDGFDVEQPAVSLAVLSCTFSLVSNHQYKLVVV